MMTKDFVRDERTGALVSNDRQKYLQRKKELEMQNRMNKMETDFKGMSQKLDLILDLLSKRS